METLEIQVDARDKQRKRDARRLLRDGKIPAILYGPKMTPVTLALDKKEFSQPRCWTGRFPFGALEIGVGDARRQRWRW